MFSKGSHSLPAHPETGVVAESQEVSANVRSRWKWVLYVTAAIGLVLALKYLHIQALLQAALDWIGKLVQLHRELEVGYCRVVTIAEGGGDTV